MSCDKYNQYYSDIVDNDGNIIKDKCFDGTSIYKNINDYNINDYMNYKNVEYYEQINRDFTRYSFPEDYDKLTYSEICEQTKYSLKPQQKFAGKIFNTHVPNNGILIYHGLGSGKTQTSIVIGEAFKFRNVKEQPIPGRADAHVLIVVPASLTEQYYLEIIGNILSTLEPI
jgi:N12 class adenine-specific DNA methylase